MIIRRISANNREISGMPPFLMRKVFLLQIWVLSVAVAAGMILKNPRADFHDDRNNSRPSETVYLVVVSHHLIIFQ